MAKTFEILENDEIKTYKISYDKRKIGEIKKRIKDYSTVRKRKISYNIMSYDAESYVKTSPYIDFDEYIGVVKEKNPEKKCIEEYDYGYDDCEIGTRYGGSHYVTSIVELKDYPYLFNVLFGKYKNNKRNIFKTILLYFDNDPVLVPSMDNDIKNILQKIYGVEVPKLVYDENIPIQEKILLIEELFSSMQITLEAEESLKNINNQIKLVSKINACKSAKTKLLKCMEDRIKNAKQNRETIDSINDYFMENKTSTSIETKKVLYL